MPRTDGRAADAVRETRITPDYTMHAEGSVLIEVGRTKVICTASVEERVPPFLRGTGKGWVTAEYGMLPRSTTTRMQREASAGKVGGRTQEIQRLIGRSLRSVDDAHRVRRAVDLGGLRRDSGRRRHAHGGDHRRVRRARPGVRAPARAGRDFTRFPITDYVAATSVGVVDGTPMLDLAYDEDSRAEVDMNVVKTSDGRFIELQGTAETKPFDRAGARRAARAGGRRHQAADRKAAGDRGEDS